MSKYAALVQEYLAADDGLIARDAQPDRYWCESMLEMEAHLGAYATLRMTDCFGGLQIPIPMKPEKSCALALIGPEKNEILCHVYGREDLPIPIAPSAILRAKLPAIVAAIRLRQMTSTDAVILLRRSGIKMTVRHLSHFINHTQTGADAIAYVPKKALPDPRQMILFEDLAA